MKPHSCAAASFGHRFAMLFDDNVNNALERDSVAIPAFGGLRLTLDQRPVPAWVSSAGIRLRWREPLGERLSLETNASLARNTALRASAHNRTWTGLSAGPRLHYALDIGGRPPPGPLERGSGAWNRRSPRLACRGLPSGLDHALRPRPRREAAGPLARAPRLVPRRPRLADGGCAALARDIAGANATLAIARGVAPLYGGCRAGLARVGASGAGADEVRRHGMVVPGAARRSDARGGADALAPGAGLGKPPAGTDPGLVAHSLEHPLYDRTARTLRVGGQKLF